eukprot:353684-Chlamydomonas_euryale.AAC.10
MAKVVRSHLPMLMAMHHAYGPIRMSYLVHATCNCRCLIKTSERKKAAFQTGFENWETFQGHKHVDGGAG